MKQKKERYKGRRARAGRKESLLGDRSPVGDSRNRAKPKGGTEGRECPLPLAASCSPAQLACLKTFFLIFKYIFDTHSHIHTYTHELHLIAVYLVNKKKERKGTGTTSVCVYVSPRRGEDRWLLELTTSAHRKRFLRGFKSFPARRRVPW